MIRLIFFFLVFFIFSCRQGAIKADKIKTEVTKGASPSFIRISSVAPLHYLEYMDNRSRNKRQSCCVGAPSRFRTNVVEKEQNNR